MGGDRLIGRGDGGDADAGLGRGVGGEGRGDDMRPLAPAQHHEGPGGLDAGSEAELHADGHAFHHRDDRFSLGAGGGEAALAGALGARQAGRDALPQHARDGGFAQDADDVGAAGLMQLLPRQQQAEHLVGVGAGEKAFGGAVGGFRPGLGDGAVIGVGGGLVADGAAHQQDLVGLFLDLPQPFLEGDGAGEILDTDAEQRKGGDLQQLGQPPDRVQLDDLALFIPVERGAGDAEAGGDLLRPETTFESVRAQLLTDIGEPHATPRPYSVLDSTPVRETSSHPLRRRSYLRDLRAACNSENETICGVDSPVRTILG